MDDVAATDDFESVAVTEGLSPVDVGKETREHAQRVETRDAERRSEAIEIVEAVLLSIVTIAVAWSAFCAARWDTESSLQLSAGDTAHTSATRAYLEDVTLRNRDATMFNTWFTAYIAGQEREQRVAERRFRPQYAVAFRAWLATKPFTNPNAPKEPQDMAVYRPTGEAAAKRLDAQSHIAYVRGEAAARHSDDYIQASLVLASVLFLVGISSHFVRSGIRRGLVVLAAALLVLGAADLLTLPAPPL